MKRIRSEAPIWTCPICRSLFVPKAGHRGTRPQKTCLKPECVYLHKREACRRLPVESMEARRERRVSALMQRLGMAFGKLTTREVKIARAVYEQAHKVGYQRGIHARRKADQRQAVAA